MPNLRQLSARERDIIGRFALQHGQVLGHDLPISDADGRISSPLQRVPLLSRLEARGTISRAEAAAGERFHELFRRASLDELRAADMSRTPGGAGPGDLPASGERCRRQVSEAMTALGGAGSAAASAVWHVVGLGQSINQWALATQRRQEFATGILVGALSTLAGHFVGHRQPRRL